ncbi:MAG: beta-N-acetylhexosaminidase, partial [Actinobacteria bacterium]|nr:beta-N-acetylhexosaminidase [Actinomycetota bacterium]
PAAPAVIPKPVSMSTGHGTFTLTRHAHIRITSAGARVVASDLAADLRPATGFPLPVSGGSARVGDIQLVLGDPGTLGADTLHEGYQLTVTDEHVTLVAPTGVGLFDGVQTIRQLLPGWIASGTARPGPWTMPAVSITDYPRYQYRGVMVDIARHFEPPAAIEKIIDEASAYKMNTLHLHLADDQGFRIVVNGFPNLTAIGGQGSVGTDGRTMDPGGYWTQAQYRQVVAYARAHFMTVVPEVDSPSHNNAIEMSEYNDTSNPLLDGHPQDIACGYDVPPVWDYTEDVGYSGMCPGSANTWTIYRAIIQQLAALSSSPYYDLGGDEAHPFTNAEYAQFVNEETDIVAATGKTPMGWADGYATTPGTTPPAGSIAESWEPGATDGAAAVQKGMKVVMAPADHAYLDQSYPNDTSGLGLGWACGGCDLDVNYDWDPGSFPGVPDSSVIGVEGALFGETIPTLADAEYLLLPRLMAIAELGWSPKADRSGPTSAAFQDFASRVAAQGSRLQASGLNFFTTTEVPWSVAGTGAGARVDRRGQVVGPLATLSAPGFAPSALTVSIAWGDGRTSAGTVSGPGPTPGRVNGLYTITGRHTYRTVGPHTATITVAGTTFSVQL